MSRYCHFYVFTRGGKVVDLEFTTCNLCYGCGEPGCRTTSSDSPGFYNECGGYTVDPSREKEVEIVDVGTPHQLELLEEYYERERNPEGSNPVEMFEKLKELRFRHEIIPEEEDGSFFLPNGTIYS